MMPAAVAAGRTPLESATLSYVVEGEHSHGLVTRQGFVKARYAGTGFMMIRRAVLEAMVERYAELRYRSEHKAHDPFEGNPWRAALFNCMIDSQTSTYLSEDYSFCKRWTDMGGEIWVDLTAKQMCIRDRISVIRMSTSSSRKGPISIGRARGPSSTFPASCNDSRKESRQS